MLPLNRREIMKAAGAITIAGFSGGVLAAASSAPSPKNRLNVILYVADDIGTDDAGCYGNKTVKTPGLDALAAEGVRFTHAFCTTASCSASRSVILTGKQNHATGHYGHSHGYSHFSTYDSVLSLPKILKQHGYLSINSGKCHVEPAAVYPFDVQHPIENPATMAERVRPYITNASTQPFFLYFAPIEPHRPFAKETSDVISPDEVAVPSYLPDIPECRRELADYYASIQQCDRGLVNLMHILKECGQWDNTIILFLSDNGAPFPGAKTNVYEPAIRLPFVVRHPQCQQKNISNNAMVSYTDVTPTLLDMLGVTVADSDFHGRSFLPILEQQNPTGWDTIYASHTFHEITMYYPMRVIRNRRYKLIWNIAHKLDFPFGMDLWDSATWRATLSRKLQKYGKRDVDAYLHRSEFELYDLLQDPDEINNLAGIDQHQETFKKMQAELKTFQLKTNDPWFLKWNHE